MKTLTLKPLEEKKKFFIKKDTELEQEYSSDDSDSDGELTDDDEIEVSKNYVNYVFNNRYLCIKYLGRGTFSRVWLVLDLYDNIFYAMKTIFSKYLEDSKHEIDVNKKLKNDNIQNVLIMKDYFLDNKRNELCIITKLLGKTVNELLMIDYDDIQSDDLQSDDIQSDDLQSDDIQSDDLQSDNLQSDDLQSDDLQSDDIQSEYDNYISPSLKIVKKFIRDVSIGLEELHRRDMVHTDLKFENILIDKIDKNLENMINKINRLNLCQLYLDKINIFLPKGYDLMDKIKKKKMKKRAKLKAINLFQTYLIDNKIINFDNFEKEEYNIYDIENMDIDSYKFIIIDLGNVEYINNREQDEIMIRSYRPPENIMGTYYDSKADMWCLGCLVYELITHNYLFNISRKKNSLDRDRYHLHKMYEYLGKMPKELTKNCDFSKDLFDSKGNILKNKKCEYSNLEELLYQESSYNDNQIKEVSFFLNKLLVYDYNKRISSKECRNLNWIKHN